MEEKIIRKTKSVCPQCIDLIDAYIVEKEDKIFMQKTCPIHGFFEIILSNTPSYYSDLEQYYFNLADESYQVPEYEFWPTYKCNISCTICCFGRQNIKMQDHDATIAQIERLVQASTTRFFILSGGEPTCREDLCDIIKIFCKSGKTVTLNTNGLKCANKDYLRALKDAGLDRINLQFDGFDRNSYVVLRGQDYLDIKLKVIENLESLRVQTMLNATIARNINENAIKELIDFAADNRFINGVNFFTICFLGGARDWSKDLYIMPDEIIDILEQQTEYKITKKNVFIFQKLHLAIKAFLSQKWCFYNQVYLLVRTKKSYQPIDRFLNIPKAEPWLDRYCWAYSNNYFWACICLGIAVGSLFIKKNSIVIFKNILFRSISYFFKTSHYLKNNDFFSISFSTGCDPYKFDYNIAKHCQNEIIAANDKSGDIHYIGSDGHYCINLERQYRKSFLKK